MKKIIFTFIIITFFSCEVQYNEIPADWVTFERKNISGIGAAKIKFKHPAYWIQNDQAQTEIVTGHLLTFSKNDSSNSKIIINAAFNVDMDKTFDAFVDNQVIPAIHGQNNEVSK